MNISPNNLLSIVWSIQAIILVEVKYFEVLRPCSIKGSRFLWFSNHYCLYLWDFVWKLTFLGVHYWNCDRELNFRFQKLEFMLANISEQYWLIGVVHVFEKKYFWLMKLFKIVFEIIFVIKYLNNHVYDFLFLQKMNKN